jgi:methyltransferase (TIGR00027 family)
MQAKEPSRTARAVARHRAVHQVLEEGAIFRDPYAAAILGEDLDALVAAAVEKSGARASRLHMAVRSRIAEDALAVAVARGVRQAVVLGAGFDTFALRNPHADLRVFEVDHPATQAWKRRRLEEAGIPVPDSLTYAPVDFERQTLAEQLAEAGLDPSLRTFFTWLGVVPYLTGDAITSTLSRIAAHPAGAEVVFDYGEPIEHVDPALRAHYQERMARVAEIGEPFLSHFVPADLHRRLRGLGFAEIDDLDVPGIMTRLSGKPPEGPIRRTGGHILFAAT